MDESFVIDTDPIKWTFTAIQCYKRGCNCKGCYISETYSSLSSHCSMKYCVRKLIRKYGLPDNVQLNETIQEEE